MRLSLVLLLLGVCLHPTSGVGKDKKKKKPSDPTDLAAHSIDVWKALPYQDLVSAASTAGLPATGTVDILAERLHGYYQDVAAHNSLAAATMASRYAPYSTGTQASVQTAIVSSFASVSAASQSAISANQVSTARANAAIDVMMQAQQQRAQAVAAPLVPTQPLSIHGSSQQSATSRQHQGTPTVPQQWPQAGQGKPNPPPQSHGYWMPSQQPAATQATQGSSQGHVVISNI